MFKLSFSSLIMISQNKCMFMSPLQKENESIYHYHKKLMYSETCVKRPLSKRPEIGFQDQLSLNTGQKYCRMLQGEHSAILLTFIKLPFVNIYILNVAALDETIIPSCLHFSMRNIEQSCGLGHASRWSNVNVIQ